MLSKKKTILNKLVENIAYLESLHDQQFMPVFKDINSSMSKRYLFDKYIISTRIIKNIGDTNGASKD